MKPLLLALLFWPALTTTVQGAWSVQQEKIAVPEQVSAPVRSVLEDAALQVRDEKENVHCTFWFRKEIAMHASVEQVKNGLTYREIDAGTFIGVVQLPRKWIDFRKQEIPAGVYTLRLGFQPTDDNHLGTAPHTEFCLLCPAGKDVEPALLEAKPLIEMSAEGHGGTHPAVLLLFPNSRPAETPALAKKEGGLTLLLVKRPILASAEKSTIGFGLVIDGHRKE